MRKWLRRPLCELAEFERELIQPDEIPPGTIYVGLEHITSNGTLVGARPIESHTLASTKFRFSNRHILYGKLRPYLAKIACPEFSGVCSTDILPILPGPEIDRRFLFHYLRWPKIVRYAASKAVGANLPRLSTSVLGSVQVPVPPLDEQRLIAEVLDRAETLIALRRQSLSLLSALVEAVFYETFGDPSRNHYAWQVAELGEFIEFGPQNGLYKPSSLYGSGTPILRIDSFYDGTITDQTALKRVAVSDAERNVYGLQPGDIVINRVNSLDYLGKCALVPTLNEPTIFESNMMRIRVDPNRLHPRFLVHLLQSNYIKSQILQKAKKAVNQASINQQDVRMLRVILPPISLQHQFVRHVESIEKHKIVHRTSLAQLEALYASLQHRAFRGEL